MKAVIVLALVFIGCATLSDSIIPALPKRILQISRDPNVPGLEFKYRVCVSRFLGICRKHEMKKDVYDFRDMKVRQQLIDMGFDTRVNTK